MSDQQRQRRQRQIVRRTRANESPRLASLKTNEKTTKAGEREREREKNECCQPSLKPFSLEFRLFARPPACLNSMHSTPVARGVLVVVVVVVVAAAAAVTNSRDHAWSLARKPTEQSRAGQREKTGKPTTGGRSLARLVGRTHTHVSYRRRRHTWRCFFQRGHRWSRRSLV